MRRIRNLIGWLKGYNGCMHCGDKWNWKVEYPLHCIRSKGFPLCRECFAKLDAKTILADYEKQVAEWRRQGLSGVDADKTIREIKVCLGRKGSEGWKGHPGIERMTAKHWADAKFDGRRKLTKGG